MGKPMIMGRATYDSIGRALPGRRSIVVSRQVGLLAEGCDVVATWKEAIVVAGDVDEVMVIGGAAIYALFLPIADRIYLTRVHADVSGDTFFPELDWASWITVETEHFPVTDNQDHAFTFAVLEREKNSATTNLRDPIDCDLHDHLEIACLFRYEVEVYRKDGSIVRGEAITTKTADKIEYLLVANNGDSTEIPLPEISRIAVLTANARFKSLDFSRDA